MKIAVLFDGAGLARLGLEQAGHECIGYEIDPSKHHLSKMVGSGNSVLMDATEVDLEPFDAIWASPPCQSWSDGFQQGDYEEKEFGKGDLLKWSLLLSEKYPNKVVWIENVIPVSTRDAYIEKMIPLKHLLEFGNDWQWGTLYNAAQFTPEPIQQRRRMIGGRYQHPKVYRPFKYYYKGVCPAITASIYHDYTTGHLDSVRRSECIYYGRCLSLREAAYHQGLEIPDGLLKSWFHRPDGYTWAKWRNNLYQAIGNGVPAYMARAFGEVYK